ncbi:hypothetical protein, partial [Wenzhouxiangella sediminis]|uniref:hypothetical protein n=1 Tax=Wenzhouxiangella sediminis TaxID=1792836 RepID=UPI001C6DF8EE
DKLLIYSTYQWAVTQISGQSPQDTEFTEREQNIPTGQVIEKVLGCLVFVSFFGVFGDFGGSRLLNFFAFFAALRLCVEKILIFPNALMASCVNRITEIVHAPAVDRWFPVPGPARHRAGVAQRGGDGCRGHPGRLRGR